MNKSLQAFEVEVAGKIVDYRVGLALDLNEVGHFFEKDFTVERLYNGGRHVIGELTQENKRLFLKLATTEGTSALLQNEKKWNDAFHRFVMQAASAFQVPKNFSDGIYANNLYYLITDKMDGRLIVEKPYPSARVPVLEESLESIIRFSEFIQTLPIETVGGPVDYREKFLIKVRAWYAAIPDAVRSKYHVEDLLRLVEKGVDRVAMKPRHGDFAPWHIMILANGKLGLIDGEHYLADGVQYYDIGYCIQRIYSVLHQPTIAEKMYMTLLDWGYEPALLSVVLASRGIGGYLDASFTSPPDFAMSHAYQIWVMDKASSL